MQVQSTMTNVASSKSVVANAVRAPSADRTKAKKVVAEVQLNRVNLRTLVQCQNGRFVSIDFIKADGESRTLTGRLGVKTPLKGGRNLVEADARPYLTVFDIQLGQYRTVNLSTVTGLRAGGKKYCVID